MANGQACHGRVLILGHSFVSRLEDFMAARVVKLNGHHVTFCGVRGATVDDIRKKLHTLDLASFCTIYVEVGTNDLCSNSADIVISHIWSLVARLRSNGAPQVILGQVLFQTRRWVRGPSVQEFSRRVRRVNVKIEAWIRVMTFNFFLKFIFS